MITLRLSLILGFWLPCLLSAATQERYYQDVFSFFELPPSVDLPQANEALKSRFHEVSICDLASYLEKRSEDRLIRPILRCDADSIEAAFYYPQDQHYWVVNVLFHFQSERITDVNIMLSGIDISSIPHEYRRLNVEKCSHGRQPNEERALPGTQDCTTGK